MIVIYVIFMKLWYCGLFKKNNGNDIGFYDGLNIVEILKMIKNNKNLPKNSNITNIFLSNGIYDSEKIISFNNEKNLIKNIEQIFK